MFHSPTGKYSPTRCPVTDRAPLNVQPVHVHRAAVSNYSMEATLPQPGTKMRLTKAHKGAAMVRAVRRNPSPQPVSLESLEAAWSRAEVRELRRPEGVTGSEQPWTGPDCLRSAPVEGSSEEGGEGEAGGGGGAPRGRRKGFRPPDVRTIFTPSDRDPRVKQESGEGHSFQTGKGNSWCDVCCDYILQGGLTCTGCKYTCHSLCRHRVSLDCTGSSFGPDQVNNNSTSDQHVNRETRVELSREEIRLKIQNYNALTTDHLKMTLGPSGVYTGFIKVLMDLRRPVTVKGGGAGARMDEAFFLPQGAVKTLHISSNNTVGEVIVALLKKFTVADNPAKYALYKHYRREEQGWVCKLSDREQPLFLRLMSGPDCASLSFVLKEQPTGDVLWEAFSIPELQNFLRILEKEEEEQKEALIHRYQTYKRRLQDALRSRVSAGGV